MSAEHLKRFYFRNDKQMWGVIIIIIALRGNLAFIARWGKEENLVVGVQVTDTNK